MNSFRILDAISSPRDLRVLSSEELNILAREIREEIVSTTSQTGGHVASSLGAVEIIVAAHSLLDLPTDKLVFDVGHQAYAHKLLTGRLDDFKKLRTYQGISGFPTPKESEYDVHPSGHASDALSVAAGLAKARQLRGSKERIVVVVGDASIAGGMAFEALNYIGQEQLPVIIILNDNEMSISHNVGALVKHFGSMRTNNAYRMARDTFQERLESQGAMGSALVNLGRNMKESMKQFFLPHAMIYEHLGIVCTMPVDGHDIGIIRELLGAVLDMDGPVLIHAVTHKGEGYEPALKDPERFHGIGPYNMASGATVSKAKGVPTFTQAFSRAIIDEAAADDRVVAITAAMRDGTGLKEFSKRFPERFIDVGIAEGHAVGMASGLAAAGLKPVVAIYSTFLQRAFDQMVIDNALPDLDVVFAIDRAGIVGEDGATHHGLFDMAYCRMVPHMHVLAPSDEAELAEALHTALALGGPYALRYPRGDARGVEVPAFDALQVWEEGKSLTRREGSDVAILAFGCRVGAALEAADLLAEEGIEARVVDMRWVKPLDVEAIERAAELPLVVTVENGIQAGGVGEAVVEVMAEKGLETPTLTLAIPDKFVSQGKIPLLLKDLGLDAEGIAQAVREKLASE